MKLKIKLCDKCGVELKNSVMIKESMAFWDIKPPKIAWRVVELCLECYNKTGLAGIDREKNIWIIHNSLSLKTFHQEIF